MNEYALTMPAVALRGMTILPGMVAHFDISREKSLKAVESAMNNGQRIFLVTQKNVEQDNPAVEDLFTIGVIAEIKQVIKLQNNIVRLLVEGISRARIIQIAEGEEYLVADILNLEQEDALDIPEQAQAAMRESILETFAKFAAVNRKVSKEALRHASDMQELDKLMDYVANNLPVGYQNKQKILDKAALSERYQELLKLMFEEMEITELKNDFQSKVRERVDKHQKEYILREQMGLIREELGEDNTDSEIEDYRRQLKQLEASKEVKRRIEKEIKRLHSLNGNSSESSVARGYIETLLELPWNKKSKDNKDLARAKKILDRDHYGLEKVKERMIEFLAVRNLTSRGEAPIICLVGPPGTGKTSIARSVAEALNKKYVRICLGGVRDEAEIRGHRKTYVGAMPGRIVSALKTAGVSNPLMLLDEIDKVSSDYKGDTSSALLEVLDAEQNDKFRDHFVELPVDLSDVMFIATANDASNIPRPLYDRMEIIEVNSYTENEKFHIAKDHLIAKQMKKNGLKPEQLKIKDPAILKMIQGYTREAGVRGLERCIGTVCRKTARVIYEGEKESVRVTRGNLEKYLGKEKYHPEKKNDSDEVGIVRGLAWTSVGGVTLEIEVNVMPGKGECKLTGQLGDVMKESAQTAVSYVRSISLKYHIPEDYFAKHDIHIHIPEGAVPKDGPSAGITMSTAILSAVAGIPVRADIAMTGEVTLRGRVLPIGGLKEKLLAANNAGMKTVCIPKDNRKDLEEISEEIIGKMKIVPVDHMEQVINEAFVKETEQE